MRPALFDVLQTSTVRSRDRVSWAQRTAVPDVDLSLAECGIIDGPFNLLCKSGICDTGAPVTLLSVTLCQWWLIRCE